MSYQTFKQYTVGCAACGRLTTKAYARQNNDKCKVCVTGEPVKGLKCPDCGQSTLTAYQKKNGYHCDQCTRVTELGH